MKSLRDILKKSYPLSITILALVELVLLCIMYYKLPQVLDSDMSSEMILAKIALQEKNLLSTSWYYSTEIRVLHIYLLFAFFFLFTDNWFVVRFLTIIALHIILIASAFYLCNKLKIKKYGPLLACMLLLSFVYYYFNYIISAACFVPFVTTTFFTIGYAVSNGEGNKRSFISLMVMLLLAFLNGMNGIRQIVITYAPLFLSCILIGLFDIYQNGIDCYKKSADFRYLLFSFVSILANGIGYIINSKILSNIYHYKTWEGLKFTDIKFDRFGLIINDFLKTFGYDAYYITLISLVSNAICFMIIVFLFFSVIKGLKKNTEREYRLLDVFFLSNMFIFIAIYTASNMHYSAAYNVPVLIVAFPLFVMFFDKADFGKAPKLTKKVVVSLFLLMFIVRSSVFYRGIIQRNDNDEIIEIADFLVKNDYQNGYASFWNANIMTELSNGIIEVYSWNDAGSDGSGFAKSKDPDDLYKWLQKLEHFEKKPQGKIFAVYRNDELNYCAWKDGLNKADAIYITDSYTVYGYDDYNTMISVLKK